MAPPTTLTEVIERANREQWPRLALLGPGERTVALGGRLGELRRRGWSEPYFVIVPQPIADPADVVSRLTRLGSLRELVLDYPRIGDAGTQAIAEHLTALTSLDLRYNDIGEAGVRAIAEHLTALTSLKLESNDIATLPERIGDITRLSSLDVTNNQLEALPRTLLRLRALVSLSVGGNRGLNLPPEFAAGEHDPARILAWYFGRKRRLNEAKVLMVGRAKPRPLAFRFLRST
jgi:hypothetical protein